MNPLPPTATPDLWCSVREVFGIDTDLQVPAFREPSEHVPTLDPAYIFHRRTTLAVLAGFTHNRRVLLQGLHGTGKSTHIEQIAARLNWPCLRLNLDSEIGRLDLLGRDAIALRDGQQVTEFRDGLLPWALQNPVALVLDEYDAGRPELMFVIQRVLEVEGKLTLPEQNRVIAPHPGFRIFATANTVGLGDVSGLYHGTQALNQGQLDRWHIIARLDYLAADMEQRIVLSRLPDYDDPQGRRQVANMVRCAELVRRGFAAGDLSTTMSPRTVLTWAENALIFSDLDSSFRLSFLNRCDELERELVEEYFQRAFGRDLESMAP